MRSISSRSLRRLLGRRDESPAAQILPCRTSSIPATGSGTPSTFRLSDRSTKSKYRGSVWICTRSCAPPEEMFKHEGTPPYTVRGAAASRGFRDHRDQGTPHPPIPPLSWNDHAQSFGSLRYPRRPRGLRRSAAGDRISLRSEERRVGKE